MFRRALHFLLALLAWSMAGAAAASAVQSEPLLSGLEGLGTAVSDEDLSNMRGRFVTPNGISYFGLEMQTLWHTPDGTATQAKLVLNLDLAGIKNGAAPQVFVSWKRDESNASLDVPTTGGQTLAASGSGLIPVGGLDTVRGAVQSQQIAGADNSVRNSMSIAIRPGTGAAADTTGMTPLTGNMTKSFADGDSIQFLLSGNQVGFVMTGDGNDAVRQTVQAGANQLAQHVLINSDFNDVFSRMNLTIGVDPASHAGTITASSAMNAMGGNGY